MRTIEFGRHGPNDTLLISRSHLCFFLPYRRQRCRSGYWHRGPRTARVVSAAEVAVAADAIISINYAFYGLAYQLPGPEGAARPFTAVMAVSTTAAQLARDQHTLRKRAAAPHDAHGRKATAPRLCARAASAFGALTPRRTPR
jgi:hypothetical protein